MAQVLPQRSSPRISVNELARFMVSSDTARFGIIKRAKCPQLPPIIRYKDVRQPICAFLSDARRDIKPLIVAEQMFRQRADDEAESSLRRDDANQSIEVLHCLQRMSNQIGVFDFYKAPTEQPKLIIAGVEISVRIDLLVHGNSRGKIQVGGAILRMTQDDADTNDARDRRRNMGQYVATLAKMQIEQNICIDRELAGRLCMSIDIQHGEVFAAPNAIVRRTNDIENACRFIAAAWANV